MRHPLYIPEPVRSDIRDHIDHGIAKAQSGFLSAHEDETSLIGALGESLRTETRTVVVVSRQTEYPGEWKWLINYTKFRGLGPNSTEKALGADGVFELNLFSPFRTEKKSLLFQSKIKNRNEGDLLEQSIKLSTWREAAFVLVFAEDKYSAIPIDAVIESRGKLRKIEGIFLNKYLGTDFLNCTVGDDELNYDARKRQLRWRTHRDEIVAADFSVGHRISVEVNAPKVRKSSPEIEDTLERNRIHESRMKADRAELLTFLGDTEVIDGRRRRRRPETIYHPDRFSGLDQSLIDILTRRTQEFNEARREERKRR